MSDNTDTRVMLITGATGGMGRACALLAAERGYDLFLSDLDSQKLQVLAQECADLGVSADYQALDVADAAAVGNFTAKMRESTALDAVIHTVGLSPHMASWDKIIQVDLTGTVNLMEEIKSALKPGGGAVCISSMSGHMVPPNPEIDAALANPLAPALLEHLANLPGAPLDNPGIAYAYAKRALLAYVAREAMAWGKQGKRLVSISPGLIDTDMGRLEAESDKDTYSAMRPMIALQRDGAPGEIAAAALFLTSAEASYITGCDLLVDGGFVASFLQSQQGAS